MMIFGKKKLPEIAPLNYWEENSIFLIVPRDEEAIMNPDDLCDRIKALDGVKVVSNGISQEDSVLRLGIEYSDNSYDIKIYPMEFSVPGMCRIQHFFPDIDIELIEKSTVALCLAMDIKENPLEAYHLQLRLADAMVSDALAVYDESAEKVLSGKWVAMAAKSDVPPSPTYLYTIQAVSGKDSSVWLHTHGLCRCGLSELEILDCSREAYNEYANIINIIACRGLDGYCELEAKGPIFVGDLGEDITLVCTVVPWNEALGEYKKNILGGIDDRKDSHNTLSSVIFVYPTPKDAENHKYAKISMYDDVIGNNPVYMISTAETSRMRALAAERLQFVKDNAGKEGCDIILKIGLTVDEEYADKTDQFEHLWFDLLEYSDGKFKAKLINEPYYITGLHEGDIGTYSDDQITDWCIYKDGRKITPDTAYLLEYFDS